MTERSLLAVAGMSEIGERVYLFVLHHGRTHPTDVAERFGIEPAAAAAELERLRHAGLVARSGGSHDAYGAVDPRSSLSSMTDGLLAAVQRIRERIPSLADQYDRSLVLEAEHDRTRVVTDAGAIAAWYVRLQQQAKREVVVFDRPPYVSSPLEPLETVGMARGVTWRAIYTPDSFTRDGAWEETLRLAEQGERARIVASLPVKLVICDESAALLSLSLDGVSKDALVTESAPLVALLYEVFQAYWTRALPLTEQGRRAAAAEPDATDPNATDPNATDPDTSRVATPPGSRRRGAASGSRPATAEEQAILALIGSGLTDEAIAARLDISVRSLRRRSQRLLAELGAENRFQAGVEAARRGWV
ncbi:Sugar-specific transcriptional regulator TrmB [Jatrophihabitans endophyticus]|uniref:Sugar-specific transcriptional regulator TrmB n=1 Tax=Jatrophihabitans endophyticus TaxID=1206085 RepID=A0A1M5C3E0_9ACTN|nr:helix-turn-helix domain-containing protein [Jatrophihabitans endophyticus]SHF49200.1 Sugar-specific transcriptional regulator TrmB [Jatrophihabitans endophyticus]